MQAHQLILIAEEQGLASKTKQALLHATYEEGQNISIDHTLRQVNNSFSASKYLHKGVPRLLYNLLSTSLQMKFI